MQKSEYDAEKMGQISKIEHWCYLVINLLWYDVPRAWNRLPAELKKMRSTPAFRRFLKTFLLSGAYD